jgi:hyperosmotically inducible protein
MSRMGSALVFGLLIVLVVACDREPRTTADAASQTRASDGARRADAGSATQRPPSEADLELSSSIQRAIVEDDSLSATARNVTVVSVDAVVTLRGRVDSPDEKQRIALIARTASGVRRVDDQIGVVLR